MIAMIKACSEMSKYFPNSTNNFDEIYNVWLQSHICIMSNMVRNHNCRYNSLIHDTKINRNYKPKVGEKLGRIGLTISHIKNCGFVLSKAFFANSMACLAASVSFTEVFRLQCGFLQCSNPQP